MTTETVTGAHRRSVEWAHQLIDGAGGTAAIEAWAAQLMGPGCLLLSGSLVEGLGNARSDLDLYFVDLAKGGPGVQMALTATSYVDVERIRSDVVRDLSTRIGRVPEDGWVARTPLGDLDLYYRLAIGVPVLADRPVPGQVSALDVTLLRRALAHWGDLHAMADAARAQLALAAGRTRHAACYAHEAVVLMATAVLARLGDGYPSAKWVDEKARRTMGPDSPEYVDLSRLLNFDLPAEDYTPTALDWVREHSARPHVLAEVTRVVGATIVAGGATGTAAVIGRSRFCSVLVDDVVAVRTVCGQNEPGDSGALETLPDVERSALFTVVAADLEAAGATISPAQAV